MSMIQGRSMVAATLFLSCISAAFAKTHVIYGEDNRRDLYDSDNNPRLVELARSTAMVVNKKDITPAASTGKVTLPMETFGESQNLCKDEPFFEQPTPDFVRLSSWVRIYW